MSQPIRHEVYLVLHSSRESYADGAYSGPYGRPPRMSDEDWHGYITEQFSELRRNNYLGVPSDELRSLTYICPVGTVNWRTAQFCMPGEAAYDYHDMKT